MKLSSPSQGLQATSGVGSSSFPLLAGAGTGAAPSYSYSGATGSGMFSGGIAGAGATAFAFAGAEVMTLASSGGQTVLWLDGTARAEFWIGSAADVILKNDAAAVLALKNGTTAQEFRVYGTTTGPKYTYLRHDGSNGTVAAQSGAMYIGTDGATDVNVYTGGVNRWAFDHALGGGLKSVTNLRFSHGTSALATNATEGFFHLQSCAGAPNGTPASIPTGQIPVIIDSTNKKLYAYIGGAWTKAQVAAVDVIFG